MTEDIPTVYDTVVHMLDDAASRAPDSIAISFGDRHLSYRDYAASVSALSRKLMGLGATGERVALYMGNSLDMAIAMFAIHAAGAQAVPLNPLYTRREAAYILNDAAPVATIHDADASTRLGSIEGAGILVPATGAGFAVTAAGGGDTLPRPLPNPDSMATLQYTGGTTGYPKGVNITHRQMSVNIAQREAILPTAPDGETVVCVMPLFHVFAVSMCLHLACYCRGRLVVLPKYHPATLCETMENEDVTILPAGPTIYNDLLSYDGFRQTRLARLAWCYSGSAPLPEETLRRWEDATGCFILEGYGQTEAGPVLTYNPANGVRKPGSVGIPLAHTEIEIVDPESGVTTLPAGQPGEIRARGPQIMTGYRNLPDETAAALRDGWLYTGDIGEFDDDGYLFIRDRKKDMAIVGGYNVFPREIEEVLHTHPAVSEAAALGLPDARYGETIHAWVTLKRGVSCAAEELIAHCEANLARYKVPGSIRPVDALPKTTVGKIDRNALRRQAAE